MSQGSTAEVPWKSGANTPNQNELSLTFRWLCATRQAHERAGGVEVCIPCARDLSLPHLLAFRAALLNAFHLASCERVPG